MAGTPVPVSPSESSACTVPPAASAEPPDPSAAAPFSSEPDPPEPAPVVIAVPPDLAAAGEPALTRGEAKDARTSTR
jgi:hypothetical protein